MGIPLRWIREASRYHVLVVLFVYCSLYDAESKRKWPDPMMFHSYIQARLCSKSTTVLFCPHGLELLWTVNELGGISLWYDPPLVWLLHKVFISLLVGKSDRILFCLETDSLALHKVARRLPTHQRVFPSMSLWEWIPVHEPRRSVPLARLRCRLHGLVYPRVP